MTERKLRDIEIKTLGMLIDEYATSLIKLKLDYSNHNRNRVDVLEEAISSRLYENKYEGEKILQFIRLAVSTAVTFYDQEMMLEIENIRVHTHLNSDFFAKIAKHGVAAQLHNAERTKAMRDIDAHDNAQALGKTYGKKDSG